MKHITSGGILHTKVSKYRKIYLIVIKEDVNKGKCFYILEDR